MPVAKTTNHRLLWLPSLCPAAAEPCLWPNQTLRNYRERVPCVVLRIAAADEVGFNCGLQLNHRASTGSFQNRLQQSLRRARSHIGSGSSIVLHKRRQTQSMTFPRCLHTCVHMHTGLCADHVETQQSTIPGCFGSVCRRKFKELSPRKLLCYYVYYALMRKNIVLLVSAELKYGIDCSEITH